MNTRIRLMAAYRLRARAHLTPDAQSIISTIEGILSQHGVEREAHGAPYPRRYIKEAPEALFDKVQRDLEKAGFKFRKSYLHKPDTRSVEAEGKHNSISYILDLVYRDGRLEVDLHY